MMKFRKPLSLLLSAAMVAGMASFAADAVVTNSSEVSAGSYYNASYLETYANSAYNETGLGSVYSKASTTWKTWSPDATAVKVKLYKTGSDGESGAGVIGTYVIPQGKVTVVLGYSIFYVEALLPNGSTGQLLDIMDYISNSFMMPFIAFLSSFFIGWVIKPAWIAEEMEYGGRKFHRKQLYNVMVQYILPVIMLINGRFALYYLVYRSVFDSLLSKDINFVPLNDSFPSVPSDSILYFEPSTINSLVSPLSISKHT